MQKLYDEPALSTENACRGYDGMRQEDHTKLTEEERQRLEAWLSGLTGYPLVDACMRFLQKSGWLNFRMRCMVVSFASYNLWLSWKILGPPLAKLFIDYEPGIHYTQLQMQNGTTGINSNRMYNPYKQTLDHDPKGSFIHQHVPELSEIEATYFCKEAIACQTAGYPPPIVSHAAAMKSARKILAEFNNKVKQKTQEAKDVFEKHGSRRPNAGDLAKTTRAAEPQAKRARMQDEEPNAHCLEEVEVATGMQRGLLVEKAKSSRSSCRSCGQKIEKGAARCALEVYYKSRWEQRWCHAECFLRECTRLVRHGSARQMKCRGGGGHIHKDDLFLKFSVGDANANWLPSEASRVMKGIAKLVGASKASEWSNAAFNSSTASISPSDRSSVLQDLLGLAEVHSKSSEASQSAPKDPSICTGIFKDLNGTQRRAFDLCDSD